MGRERVVVRQLAHLLHGCLHQGFFAEAQRRVPQSTQPFDVFPSMFVVDVDTLAVAQHEWAGLLVLGQVGVGVQMVGYIALRGHTEFFVHQISFPLQCGIVLE